MMIHIKEIADENFANGEIITVKYNDINNKYYGCLNNTEVFTYSKEEIENETYVLVTMDNFVTKRDKILKKLESEH
mgnify:CR=1 FL=1